MASCGPTCTIPSCASIPVVGLGSAGIRANYGRGLGYGNLGSGYGGLGYGSGAGALAFGGSTSSGELGTLAGVIPQPINQIPPSEVVIQPPPSVVTIPGAILSASCEPVSVGGITPTAIGGSGIGGSGSGFSEGFGSFRFGAGRRRFEYFGRGSLLGRRGTTCLGPAPENEFRALINANFFERLPRALDMDQASYHHFSGPAPSAGRSVESFAGEARMGL
ncbi:uncharacterized protein [Tiliqua scincoides]|uniref:uncharacterized protein n=1 Tax=Tiliqua scincoides TaxID=71010 RepID=UPI003461BDE4